jgi:ATP-dependent DNA helicase RecG
MQLTKEQEIKFKKLGINSITELALIVPTAYEDYRLSSRLVTHKPQLIDATVESLYRGVNSLQITFYVHNFGHKINGVIFHPKPYMLHQFKVGERDYYYGLVDCKNGQCTMSMPKRVTQVGKISPRYKTKLRLDVMQRLVEELVNLASLTQEGIKESIAKELLSLHFPDETIFAQKEFSKKILYALKYTELFIYMKNLSKKRKYFQASYKEECSYVEFMQGLPFELTHEQKSAIEDIKNDFASGYAARRMVVGDVGSGKTMVILAAAFMAAKSRSVLMAPTTILAKQLYEEALKYLPNMKTVLVTNKTKKEDLSVYEFIIGTHALLYRELPQAAVVMVDEQHRFGTKQRNFLEKLLATQKRRPHYIQFSATPIPRTQAMIESAHIDVSLITTTPFSKDIDSKVIHKEDFTKLREHIESEIAKGHQILLVYPLVEESSEIAYQSIEEARGYWEKNFEGVYVTHGKDKAKEDILLAFRQQGSILIATTVVEVGISLPRLSTVVIVGAERLGLSTLHQLRGRVSRTGLKGYCFLYTNKHNSQRLEEFVSTKSGFDIAKLDLKYRQSGDLLKGLNQSGKSFVWFDFGEDESIAETVKKDLAKMPSLNGC